jgi:hypothetical protein
LFALPILVLCQAAATTPAGPDEIPLALRVNKAIALGVDCLKHRQLIDGSFGGHDDHPGGVTALVAFTLARSGVRKDDPALTRAWAALAGVEFRSVYSASMHLLLCETLRDPGRSAEAQRSLDLLLENREQGVWAYPWGRIDNSNTQFALLALRAASRMGLAVPEKVWLEALDGLSLFQDKGGGSFYAPNPPRQSPNAAAPYLGMTAASLASLAVLQEAAADQPRLRAALERCKLVEAGERWLERHFDVRHNYFEDGSWKASGIHLHAYLWALERWCGLTGRAKVAGRDWYAEGADMLLGTQARDGSWDGDLGPEPTCFALLFLRRATITPDEELAELQAALERDWAAAPVRPTSSGAAARRLTQWWLAGPWNGDGDEPLLLDPPFDPAELKPRARTKLAKRDWERVTLQPDRATDLELLTGRKGDGQLWVLATRFDVSADGVSEPLEALLWLELDEGWDVWLDGQRLSRERRRGGRKSPDVSLPLRLAPGEHLLGVLVEDLRGMTTFGALLTGADNGAPPPGLREHPEPEEKGK